jgi:hypothetical protein
MSTPRSHFWWVLPYWSTKPQKAVVTTVRRPEYPRSSKKKTFFSLGCGGNPAKCGRGSGLLTFHSDLPTIPKTPNSMSFSGCVEVVGDVATALAAIQVRFGEARRVVAREVTQADVEAICKRQALVINDVVEARSKVALIKELDAKIAAVDAKLVPLAALAAKEEAERALGLPSPGLPGLCSSSLKCNNEERHLDHEMHALVERKALVSKELDAVCEGLRGRLGVGAIRDSRC